MKVSVNERGVLVLKEIFGNTVLETAEGNQLVVNMRDNTFEMSVVGSERWWRFSIEDAAPYEL
jgi:hypothetical protein